MKRLARNAAELMTLTAALQSDGIQLELLTGPLTGVYDPTGMGSMLFAVLACRLPRLMALICHVIWHHWRRVSARPAP